MEYNTVILLLTFIVTLFLTYSLCVIVPWLYNIYIIKRALKKFEIPIKYGWITGNLAAYPGPVPEGFEANINFTKMGPRKYTFHFGSLWPILALTHPETAKEVLKTSEPKSLSGGGMYSFIVPWVGDSLLVSKGRKWARNRRMLTPAFHIDKLKSHLDIFNSSVHTLMDSLEKLGSNGESVEMCGPIGACTLDIIVKSILSADENDQVADECTYTNSAKEILMLVIDRVFKPHLYIDTLYYLTSTGRRFQKLCNELHRKTMSAIKQRKQALETGQAQRDKNDHKDFLDVLLMVRDDKGQGLSDEEIKDEIQTFLFAGHDTTSSAISWTLYFLAKYPEYQAKVREEVDSIMSEYPEPLIKWVDLNRLTYTTMCIKESLRMHPPTPFIGRQISCPITVDGHKIPARTFTDIPIHNIHHNATVWGPDHMTYDPERFAPDKLSTMDPYAFIPFSAGPRNCIGQHFAMAEIKVVVSHIVYRFNMVLDIEHLVRPAPLITTKAENGIKVYFERRK